MNERRSRYIQRQRLSIEDWRAMVDDDLDEQDRRFDAFAGKLDSMNRILFGILVSLTTGAVLLAANLGLAK